MLSKRLSKYEGLTMGFTEVLTIVFVVCKLLGIITWSWWLVLLPEIIAVAFYVIFVILAAAFGFHTWKGLK